VKLKTSLEETFGPAPIFTYFPTNLYCSPVETLGKIVSLLESVEIDFYLLHWSKDFTVGQSFF